MILTTYGVMEGGKLMKKNFYKKAASVVLSVAMVTGGTVVPNVVAYADDGTSGQLTNEISALTFDVDQPVAGGVVQTAVTGVTEDKDYIASLSWSENPTGKYGYNKTYTATVTFTAKEGKTFSDKTLAGGWTKVSLSEDKKEITFSHEFATTAKAKIKAVGVVSGKVLTKEYASVDDIIKDLQQKVDVETEDGKKELNLKWSCSNYDKTPQQANAFTWTAENSEFDANGKVLTDKVDVINAKAAKEDVKITAVAKEPYVYEGKSINLSDLFTVDKTGVTVKYTMDGGTGEGSISINGKELTVTKAGTFKIKAVVEASDSYNAASETNTITVDKGTLTANAPTYVDKTATSVKLATAVAMSKSLYGYATIDDSSKVDKWQESQEFKNLKAGGTYYFFIKLEDTDLYNGAVSSALPVTLSSEIGSVSINVTAPSTGQTAQKTVDSTESYTGKIAWYDANGKAFNGTFKANTAYTAVVTLTPKAGYTFSSSIKADGWNAKVDNGKLILTKKFDATKDTEKTPNVAYDYSSEKLTGLVKGSTYIIDDKEYTTASNGTTIAINEAWFGKTISIVKKGTDKTDNSAAQSLEIPSRPDAPTRKLKVTATKSRVEVTNADDYSRCEFSMDGANWQNSGVFKGTYKNNKTYIVYVREKATTRKFASKSASKNFEVDKDYEYNLSGDNRIDRGDSITFRVKNADKDEFVKILIDDEKLADRYFSVSESGSYAVIKVKGSYTEDLKKGDHDVEIVFSDGSAEGTFRVSSSSSSNNGSSTRYYTIKATAGKGGSISYEGSKDVKKGSDITYTITPDRGYKISDVYVNGRSKGDISKYTFKDVDSDNKIEAEFVKEKKDDIPFTDVYETDSFYDAVVDVYKKGLMSGTSDTTFSPNATLTRAMVVKTLYNIEGMPKVYGRSSFTDVPSNEWYSDAVAWAQSVGIASGMTKTTFNPNGYVTKEQAAQFLYTYAKFKGYNVSEVSTLTGYVDAPTGWSRPAVSWAVGSGIMKGYGSGYAMYLAPSTNALRSDIAMMLSNFTDKY